MWSILKALRENPEILIESQRRRGEDVEVVYRAIELDKRWREELFKLNQLRRERNQLSEMVKKAKGEEKRKLIEKAKEISEMVKKGE
ncbi:MAG: serine--tRNA ligase, partial [Archaeoglobi archaeon]|nr:serine--tRNA ligase [Archaeoglobi archaeon]